MFGFAPLAAAPLGARDIHVTDGRLAGALTITGVAAGATASVPRAETGLGLGGAAGAATHARAEAAPGHGHGLAGRAVASGATRGNAAGGLELSAVVAARGDGVARTARGLRLAGTSQGRARARVAATGGPALAGMGAAQARAGGTTTAANAPSLGGAAAARADLEAVGQIALALAAAGSGLAGTGARSAGVLSLAADGRAGAGVKARLSGAVALTGHGNARAEAAGAGVARLLVAQVSQAGTGVSGPAAGQLDLPLVSTGRIASTAGFQGSARVRATGQASGTASGRAGGSIPIDGQYASGSAIAGRALAGMPIVTIAAAEAEAIATVAGPFAIEGAALGNSLTPRLGTGSGALLLPGTADIVTRTDSRVASALVFAGRAHGGPRTGAQASGALRITRALAVALEVDVNAARSMALGGRAIALAASTGAGLKARLPVDLATVARTVVDAEGAAQLSQGGTTSAAGGVAARTVGALAPSCDATSRLSIAIAVAPRLDLPGAGRAGIASRGLARGALHPGLRISVGVRVGIGFIGEALAPEGRAAAGALVAITAQEASWPLEGSLAGYRAPPALRRTEPPGYSQGGTVLTPARHGQVHSAKRAGRITRG